MSLPLQPVEKSHPGSEYYQFGFEKIEKEYLGREVVIFLPKANKLNVTQFPMVVFGHGQAIGYEGYELSFEHFAKKGVMVVHPMYDRNFFDRNWRRMASDFNKLTDEVLKEFGAKIDRDNIVYAGHSKGAYIGLMAAGAPNLSVNLKSLVLLAPAGFDEEYLSNLPTDLPVNIMWAKSDRVIKENLIDDIFNKAPSDFIQVIKMEDYDELAAGHMFPLSKRYIFGGKNGISNYHYEGMWKWILGAVEDDGSLTNQFLYGTSKKSNPADTILLK